MTRNYFLALAGLFLALAGNAQVKFNGIESGMSNIYRLSDAKTRSISAENYKGEPGKGGMATEGMGKNAARDLGQGWKISPCVTVKKNTTFTIAEINGPGSVQHIWFTPTGNWRYSILRVYYDDEPNPSIETPIGDFFCSGWGSYAPLVSLPICVNPGSAFNSYWPMPFRKKFRMTLENIDESDMVLYYQVDYILTEVPSDAAYLHAQFRRVNPLPYKTDFVLVDGIRGKGQYVGTYMAIGVHNNGWWGEGEVKFFMDDDTDYPTYCGTGTEDYFCGSYDFDTRRKMPNGEERSEYTEFNTPYSGLNQVIRGDGHYNSSQRFGLYRWHITDPIRFEKKLKVTIQDLGWRSGGRYFPQQDDIATTVFWYQTEPHNPFPKFPTKDELEVN